MNEPQVAAEQESTAPKWKPIGSIDRRILGVLAEKAKTTPDQYPLSLNALKSGCNQKSNRSPQMNLELDEIEEALDRLRGHGAVAEVTGGGRVARYRHYLYEWLGVDKTELAVMAELLLRGAQTVGELRGRAARMEPIADVAALRPIVDSLIGKGLVLSLTPEGRGRAVTHALYREEELEKIKRQIATDAATEPPQPTPPASAPTVASSPAKPPDNSEPASAPTATVNASTDSEVNSLRREVETLRNEVTRLRTEIEDIWSNIRS